MSKSSSDHQNWNVVEAGLKPLRILLLSTVVGAAALAAPVWAQGHTDTTDGHSGSGGAGGGHDSTDGTDGDDHGTDEGHSGGQGGQNGQGGNGGKVAVKATAVKAVKAAAVKAADLIIPVAVGQFGHKKVFLRLSLAD